MRYMVHVFLISVHGDAGMALVRAVWKLPSLTSGDALWDGSFASLSLELLSLSESDQSCFQSRCGCSSHPWSYLLLRCYGVRAQSY